MSDNDPWKPGTYQYPLFREEGGKYKYHLETDLKRKREYGKVWEQEWEVAERAKRLQDVTSLEKSYQPRPRPLSEDEKRALVADLTVLLGEHCASLLEASNAAVALANLYHMEKKT